MATKSKQEPCSVYSHKHRLWEQFQGEENQITSIFCNCGEYIITILSCNNIKITGEAKYYTVDL